MITVAEARASVAARLRRNLAAWATAVDDVAVTTLNLKPPTEREVLADERAAEAWARSWAELGEIDGVELTRTSRTWRSIGRQTVPERLTLTSARAAAAFVGGAVQRDHDSLVRLTTLVLARLGDGDTVGPALRAVVRQQARRLLDLTSAEVTQVLDAVAWLTDHDVAGLRPRQVPVRGVDSKWFEKHRTLVAALHAAASSSGSLGIVDADVLLRVRFLDPTLAPGGVSDLAAPVAQLAALAITPRSVLLVENRETLLALPTWPGVVAIHSPGYAVPLLDDLAWVWASDVVYWGDLDSHGFAILARLRAHHPGVTTVLMDEPTLEAHLDLAVVEPRPARGTFPSLTSAERRTLERLRAGGDLRLEQERVAWDHAIDDLARRLGPPCADEDRRTGRPPSR